MGAGRLLGEGAEGGLAGGSHRTGAVAVSTRFRAGALGAAAAAAGVAGFNPADADLLLGAKSGLLEGDLYCRGHILTLGRGVAPLLGAAAKAAEEISKDIAQIAKAAEPAEGIPPLERIAACEVGIDPGEAELVVSSFFIRVG